MSVATWPGTGYGPTVQIGYEAELGCEFQWDCAVWGGELPEPPAADLFEPFDNFTDNGWTLTGVPTIVAGRTGTAAQVTATTPIVAYPIPTVDQSDTVTVGFAFRATGVSASRAVLQLYSDGNTIQHNRLMHNASNGQLTFWRSTAATLGTSATGVIVTGTWHYIEVRAVLHDTAGSVIVRVDGVEVINVTGQDTKQGGTKTVYDTVRLLVAVSANTNQYDDLYLTSGPEGAFLGDITLPLAASRVPVEDPGRWGPWWDWRNVECDVRAGSNIVRGTASPGQRASSSTASISITPRDNTLAPWYVDPTTGVRPNRGNLPIRIGVTHLLDDTTSWLFTGWIDYITEVDSPDELSLTVVASDGFKHLALLDQAEQAAQGAGEAAGARIGRILDHAGWQSGRDLSLGTFALQATTLARPALEEIFLTADTEGGVVWVDVHGALRFGDRDWLRQKATATDWQLGDRQLDADAICVSSIVTTADDMDIQNVVGISRIGGTASWLEDAASIAKYGRHSWSRFDLPYANDSDTPTILAFQLADRVARDYHAQAVVLSPLSEPAAWACVLDVDLYDTVYLTRSRGEDHLAELGGVIGIDHSFGPGEFVTVLSLGPRIRQTLSRWDVDRWDSARWSGT